MLNQAKEELNKLIQRLEMLFQVQTHEVVQDLKKIRDLLNTPEEVEAPKTPKAKKEVIQEEPKQEIIEEIVTETEWQETRDIEKEAKQYLKEKEVSNRKFLKGEKAINKAIELGFIV